MIPLNWSSIIKHNDHNFSKAVRLLQIGDLHHAVDALKAATATYDHTDHKMLAGHIRQMLDQVDVNTPVSLIWQMNPGLWEGDWIRSLLLGSYHDEIVDMKHEKIRKLMIVVDNKLNLEKEAYYRKAFEAGNRIFLIHLSDESFSDDLSSYGWCNIVYRNYWSPLLECLRHVNFFPLGYKIGFEVGQSIIPAVRRENLWSFAGDPNKTTRQEMIADMTTYAEGKLHLTSGFHSSDNLSVRDYQSLMQNSVFVPCPKGNVNFDSYRVCEALECGAIPIVERGSGFDYFSRLFGLHPIPTLSTWAEAPKIIDQALVKDGGVGLQNLCHQWWTHHKAMLGVKIRGDIAAAFGIADSSFVANTPG